MLGRILIMGRNQRVEIHFGSKSAGRNPFWVEISGTKSVLDIFYDSLSLGIVLVNDVSKGFQV